MERSKNLRPTFSQHELVLQLEHHFHRDIRLAIYSQGIKTIEELLILLAQSEHIVNDWHTSRSELRERSVNFVQREENYCEEKNTLDPLNAGKGEKPRERNASKYGEQQARRNSMGVVRETNFVVFLIQLILLNI